MIDLTPVEIDAILAERDRLKGELSQYKDGHARAIDEVGELSKALGIVNRALGMTAAERDKLKAASSTAVQAERTRIAGLMRQFDPAHPIPPESWLTFAAGLESGTL